MAHRPPRPKSHKPSALPTPEMRPNVPGYGRNLRICKSRLPKRVMWENEPVNHPFVGKILLLKTANEKKSRKNVESKVTLLMDSRGCNTGGKTTATIWFQTSMIVQGLLPKCTSDCSHT